MKWRFSLDQLEAFLEDRVTLGDNIMLVGFNRRVLVVQSFTRDREEIALRLCQHQRLLGALGDHLLMLGDAEGARKAWERAVEGANEEGGTWAERLELLELRGEDAGTE